jgi:Icc-related predicted phosphoesterase
MRILVMSDLHLDQNPVWGFPEEFPPHDVAVFPGDITSSTRLSMKLLSNLHPLRNIDTIVFTPGNHEFYGSDLADEIRVNIEYRSEMTKQTGVHAGNVQVEDVLFIPATLWTDYDLQMSQAESMIDAERGLNDHRCIKYLGGPLRAKDLLELHKLDLAHIKRSLESHDGRSVVVTHHAPHPGSISPQFHGDQLNPAFVSCLSDFIHELQPTLWIHGHVHTSNDYMVGKTRVLCNPKGYGPRRMGYPSENPRFNPELVVEI